MARKKNSEKKLRKTNHETKFFQKKFQKKSAGKSRDKWAQRDPLFAAKGCSSPQELEKSQKFSSFIIKIQKNNTE